jgi:hypothetical protein
MFTKHGKVGEMISRNSFSWKQTRHKSLFCCIASATLGCFGFGLLAAINIDGF